MKRVFYLVFALCLLAVPAFAQEATPEATPEMGTMGGYAVNAPTDLDPTSSLTSVYFAHTAADVGPVDIYMTERPDTPVVANLGFGEVTEEVMLPSTATFAARMAGDAADSPPLAQLDFDLGGNTTWVISVVGLASNASVLLEPLSVVRTDYNDMARVRVMNLVATGDTYTVTSDSDINFGTELEFHSTADNDIEPGTHNLTLTDADGNTVGESQSYTFDANTTTTLLIVGGADGTPVQVIPITSERYTNRVQFVNNGTDPVDVFTRPGGSAIVSNLAGGATSEWVDVPSGAVTFITYAPGTGPTGQELAALPIQLAPWRDVVVTFGADGQAELSSTSFSPNTNMDMSASG